MGRKKDMEEMADTVNPNLARATDRKNEMDEIGRVAQNRPGDGQTTLESVQIYLPSKAKTLLSKTGAYAGRQSLLAVILTLVTVFLLGLLLNLERLASFVSRGKKSGKRHWGR